MILRKSGVLKHLLPPNPQIPKSVRFRVPLKIMIDINSLTSNTTSEG